eukprot:GHVR01035556.1.p1 GENE.GHVR01035556.1~~GHVR01035556.1.p1  ORF type:complete len:120 (+),score=18.22 GHVR01035556.1:107-466(+)
MIPLGPQLKDHNYSLSDPDEKENSCDESVRRSKKRIPPWAEVNELHRQLKEQDNVDPSSIFALGCYVPRLNGIFLYIFIFIFIYYIYYSYSNIFITYLQLFTYIYLYINLSIFFLFLYT